MDFRISLERSQKDEFNWAKQTTISAPFEYWILVWKMCILKFQHCQALELAQAITGEPDVEIHDTRWEINNFSLVSLLCLIALVIFIECTFSLVQRRHFFLSLLSHKRQNTRNIREISTHFSFAEESAHLLTSFLRALRRRVVCASMNDSNFERYYLESACALAKSYTCTFWNCLS